MASFCHADAPADGAVTMSADSKALTVSSTTVSPTQILSRESFILRTWIVNTSTFPVFISTFTHSFSTATEMQIPASTTFSPDGPIVPYWGPLFGVLGGTSAANGGNNITILRTK